MIGRFFPFRYNYWVISLFCRFKQAEVQFFEGLYPCDETSGPVIRYLAR